MSAPEQDFDASEDDTPNNDSWDSFWAEVESESNQRTETIRGVTVVIPSSLPLKFSRELERLQDSDGSAELSALLINLFGQDVFDAWTDAGMSTLELQVVLAWVTALANGQDITFRRALELVRERGKEAAEAASQTHSNRSAGSGGPSKRTSSGNTASNRRR